MQRVITSLKRPARPLPIFVNHNLQEPPRCTARCCSSYITRRVGALPEQSDHHSNGLVQVRSQFGKKAIAPPKVLEASQISDYARNQEVLLSKKRIGDNISSREKNKFLLDLLFGLKDSKEAVYGALDAWVAWERDFPLVALKRTLVTLQKDEQWHRIIQVLKWMLSKGQGNTMGTYEQLIRALEKDHRAEEAHSIWVKKISYDLHPVPWRVCDLMISIYYRNNMLERLIKLFKGLEAFDRKPPKKSIVRKVADAYEMLGLLEEKDWVLEKYNHLFMEPPERLSKKFRNASKKINKKTGKGEHSESETPQNGSVPCDLSHDDASATKKSVEKKIQKMEETYKS